LKAPINCHGLKPAAIEIIVARALAQQFFAKVSYT